MIKYSAYALGATLYMPATRPDILDVVMGEKIHGLRSLVICLEDAVAETDVQQALNNLKNLLLGIDARGGRPSGGPMVFVRPRDAAMAAVLNEWSLMRHVDGFVVPKLRLSNIHQWQQAVTRDELTSARPNAALRSQPPDSADSSVSASRPNCSSTSLMRLSNCQRFWLSRMS